MLNECIWFRIGTTEHGNEPSGSKKGREFFSYLSDFQLLKDTAPWT